jgi:threonyl-tRNA synthetase
VVGVPVADEFAEYLEDFVQELRAKGVRAEVDRSDNRMQKKIRDHTLAKVPFILLAGGRDVENGTFSFRYRDGSQENDLSKQQAFELIMNAIESKTQV